MPRRKLSTSLSPNRFLFYSLNDCRLFIFQKLFQDLQFLLKKEMHPTSLLLGLLVSYFLYWIIGFSFKLFLNAGVGKTTTILCLARQLLGPAFKEAVLELNASNERGIDVVRNRIKMFAQQKVTLPKSRHKIVILDEADAMTGAAQQALRRTMEMYSNTTRFALAANSSEKIIEPIQSRCAMLRYSRLSNPQILAKLLDVCDKEGVHYTEDGLEAIVFTAQGDMRQALNNLQVLFICFIPH